MKSLEELRAIRERMQKKVSMDDADATGTRVVVGMATCGIASGARPVYNTLVEEVQSRGIQDVSITQTGCIGLCQYEPIVEIYEAGKEKVTYSKVNPEKAKVIVERHLQGGEIVDEYTLKMNIKKK